MKTMRTFLLSGVVLFVSALGSAQAQVLLEGPIQLALLFFNRSLDLEGCFLGTINAEAGATMDVLFVNGSSGIGPERRVSVVTGDPIEISLNAAPGGPIVDSAYLLLVWRGLTANPVRLKSGNRNLGCLVSPSSFQPSLTPQPFVCLRGEDYPGTICDGVRERPAPPAAPWTVRKNGGLPVPADFLFQGILRDQSVTDAPRYSVTNAVVLEIVEAR